MAMRGYTLIELLTSLTILALIFAIGLPSFSETINKNRTKTAALILLEAIQTTRSQAVFNNQRVLMKPKTRNWHEGWRLFIDLNDNGELDESEQITQETEPLEGVTIQTNMPLRDYISFIGSGEGRKAGKRNGGVPQMGTMEICPNDNKGDGYAIILSRGGRARMEARSSTECSDDEI